MTKRKMRASQAQRLHRALGVIAATFIIFMVLTGLAINHSGQLDLDLRRVSQPVLLDWYGLGKPEHIRSFELADQWLSFADSQVYLNGKHVAVISNAVGAVANNDMIIVAGSDELLLLDHAGNMVERSTWSPPGSGSIDSIGLLDSGHVVLKSKNRFWLSDAELLSWKQVNDVVLPTWPVSIEAPAFVLESVTEQYRGDGLSLERLLLDLHSGRFFGTAGILVYDLLALVISLMAISGLVLWVRGRRKGKSKDIRQKSRH